MQYMGTYEAILVISKTGRHESRITPHTRPREWRQAVLHLNYIVLGVWLRQEGVDGMCVSLGGCFEIAVFVAADGV